MIFSYKGACFIEFMAKIAEILCIAKIFVIFYSNKKKKIARLIVMADAGTS